MTTAKKIAMGGASAAIGIGAYLMLAPVAAVPGVSFGARPAGVGLDWFCAVEKSVDHGPWAVVPGLRNCYGPMTGVLVMTNQGEGLALVRERWHRQIEPGN